MMGLPEYIDILSAMSEFRVLWPSCLLFHTSRLRLWAGGVEHWVKGLGLISLASLRLLSLECLHRGWRARAQARMGIG